MPVTRSKKGTNDDTPQLPPEEIHPVPAEASTSTTSGTSSATDTTNTGTTTTGTTDATVTDTTTTGTSATTTTAKADIVAGEPEKALANRSIRMSRAGSHRSGTSRKRLLAELEAKERVAQQRLAESRAAMELAQIQLQKVQLEQSSDDEDDEVQSNGASVIRVQEWLEKQADMPPPPQPKEVQIEMKASEEPPTTHQEQDTNAKVEQRGQGAHADKGHEHRGQLKEPRPARSLGDMDVTTLATAIAQGLRVGMKKVPAHLQDLPSFNGNSGSWLTFRAMYNETKEYFTDNENVVRLRKCLRSTALEAVSSLLIRQPDPQEILDSLERRFGRPDALILLETDKLKKIPRVNDNPRDICIFASRVANIVATIEAMKKVHYLYNSEMVRTIIDKLTPVLREKWYDYAATIKEETPDLKKMAKFLNHEADKRSAYAPPEQTSEPVPDRKKKIEHTYAAQTQAQRTPNAAKREECPLCKRSHRLRDCDTFLNATTNERWDLAKRHRTCYRCLASNHRRFNCKAPLCGQSECQRPHHQLLHYEKTEVPGPKQENEVSATTIECVNNADTSLRKRRAYLKIVPVLLTAASGGTVEVFALLDEGSTITIIDGVIAEMLGLDGPIESMWVQGVGGIELKHEKSKSIDIRVRGKYADETYTLRNARTVERLNFTTQAVTDKDIEDCYHLRGLEQDLMYDEASPKLLIGQDNWDLIVSREVRAGRRDQPVASLTQLGWVLHGCRSSHSNPVAFCGHLTTTEKEDNIEEMMKRYFELDSIGIEPKKMKGDPEQRALDTLDATSRRLPDGRFETGLLWKEKDTKIPNNYENAVGRLHNLEKKLDRNPDLKSKYEDRIMHLFEAGYAEPATTRPKQDKTWYLPHFAVINPAKPKIRVVHDAAARCHGRSLNDMLLPGPDLLQSLPGVVMRFRQHPIAVSADIKEMFMQIKIRDEDRDALRFLWRGNERGNAPPDEYRMTSVIFGATSSPCTALYIKNKNAEDFVDQHPKAVDAIIRNHYMDDYIMSFENTRDAIETTKAVDFIHRQAGFELRGWASNDGSVVRQLTTDPGGATVPIGGSEIERTLGLLWDTDEDCIGFHLNKSRTPAEVLQNTRPPTKREALSIIMSLYDPLGLVSPVTTPAKRLMQETWRYGMSWDDPLPEELRPKWSTWLDTLRDLQRLRVPRCYDSRPTASHELHTFVDASEEAYAAAVYWRLRRADGSIHIALAAAKSRVTPLKPVSIPRLELQAALLGARLARTVLNEHDYEATQRTFWSDSRTALAWIRAEPRSFKTFVAHRLAEIEELTKKSEWKWLPTEHNVADDATRATPSGFDAEHRWYRGPEFLYRPENEWPVEETTETAVTGEERDRCYTAQERNGHAHLPEVTRFSKWNRLIRATARVVQFIELCRPSKHTIAGTRRKRTRPNTSSDETWKNTRQRKVVSARDHSATTTTAKSKNYLPLEARHLSKAEQLWIKAVQTDSFSDTTRLASLTVYNDIDGVLRVKSRIHAASNIDDATASPAVLDGDHRYTKLYILHVHTTLHHGGVETVVNELRQRLWIVRVRPAVKHTLKTCMPCRLKKAKPARPLTGDLPHARLAHHERPFTFTGLDYFGPYEVTVARHHEKRYVALFTCMTSRAVHLEVAASLSADSAIAALRRFIARRGCPREIWSDNATCFKAADKEISEAALSALREEATNRRITWRFQPPAAPFMCGVWERMVRSVKQALSHTLHQKYPSDETLTTLLAEVECTVNSRPLTHVAVTPDEPYALTPNHILLGPNCHVPAPGDFESNDLTARQLWRRTQRLADDFWRRWVREYLPLLQYRRETSTSGTVPKVGDVVVVCDPNSPRNTWPRGLVTRTFPGKDGEVRVVDIKTSNGHTLRRPTKKIVVLPVESQCDGGRNVHDD